MRPVRPQEQLRAFLQTRADKVADSGYSDRPDGCARGFRQNIAQTGTLHLLTENTDQSAQDIADSGAQTGQLEHVALHAENLHIGRINIFFFLFGFCVKDGRRVFVLRSGQGIFGYGRQGFLLLHIGNRLFFVQRLLVFAHSEHFLSFPEKRRWVTSYCYCACSRTE